MFIFKQILPGRIFKIPQPFTCFEEVPGAVVDLAVKAGEAAAAIENLEAETEEQKEQLETLEQRTKWNDQALDAAFERIWSLEGRIEELTARLDILEAQEAVEEEEGQEPPVTEIAPPAGEKNDPPKAKRSWSLF